VPGKRDSAGSQFFICVTDQPALDGNYTVFGRVTEGLDVVTKISEAAVDADGRVVDRIEMRAVTIRDKPSPAPEPFSTETVVELAAYRAVLETSAGPIAIELFPDQAPNHVRNFLRLAAAGVYDGTSFHRVARGFVIQTGWTPSRATPLTEAQQRAIPPSLFAEPNAIKHVEGTVSMARGDDPASASTSFFIVTATTPALDGKYTAFGKVAAGLDVVHAIEAVPVAGETPRTRVDLHRVRVEKR
jgi:peptidyl-prolyl cis-trans isomerase B (cyclophilin B)